MKKYYLETNALISLSRYLKDDRVTDNCYTSSYVLFELIASITVNNFRNKRGPLKQTMESNITMVWDLPQVIVGKMFGILVEVIQLRELEQIVDIICKSESFEEANQIIEEEGLELTLEKVKAIKEKWNSNFIETTKEGIDEIQDILAQEKKDGVKLSESTLKAIEQNKMINASCTLMAHALKLEKDTGHSHKEMYEAYKGDKWVYVAASSEYYITKSIRQENAKRNDVLDLGHLLYLERDQAIVSNDGIYRLLKEKVSILNLMSIEEIKVLLALENM
ncbi:MAG: hypothetical protein J5I47_07870 [Vicingus serpentipes]|nr:hypothetical protein [Vicingus serpentipes]